MPLWTPTPDWAGQDAFIIGGGPSLRGFDWSTLHGRNVIGCNFAFRLGPKVVSYCFFSDDGFFYKFEKELRASGIPMVTHCHQIMHLGEPWLKKFRREPRGLHKHALGFGNNSGCGAVNLALLLGARNVYLLGFDNKPDAALPDQSHWHDWRIEKPQRGIYEKFQTGWEAVHFALPRIFPGCRIINLNPDSALPFFDKQAVESVLPAHAHHC